MAWNVLLLLLSALLTNSQHVTPPLSYIIPRWNCMTFQWSTFPLSRSSCLIMRQLYLLLTYQFVKPFSYSFSGIFYLINNSFFLSLQSFTVGHLAIFILSLQMMVFQQNRHCGNDFKESKQIIVIQQQLDFIIKIVNITEICSIKSIRLVMHTSLYVLTFWEASISECHGRRGNVFVPLASVVYQ